MADHCPVVWRQKDQTRGLCTSYSYYQPKKNELCTYHVRHFCLPEDSVHLRFCVVQLLSKGIQHGIHTIVESGYQRSQGHHPPSPALTFPADPTPYHDLTRFRAWIPPAVTLVLHNQLSGECQQLEHLRASQPHPTTSPQPPQAGWLAVLKSENITGNWQSQGQETDPKQTHELSS